MNEPRNDDERLSALLDGRMKDPQRRELLAHLSASEDDLEVLADTAVILRQLEEGARTEPPKRRRLPFLPPSTRRAGWRNPVRWAGLAAAGVLVLAAVWVTWGGASAPGDPVRLAARLSGTGLPERWTEERPWDMVRSAGAPSARTPEGRAAEAGALLTDLAVAVRARDAANTELLAGQLRSRFEPGAVRGAPLLQIADRAGEPPASLEPLLARATKRLELDEGFLQLGAWTEAALLAAHRHDAAFFRDDESSTMLGRAEKLTAGDARVAVDRVRVAAAVEPPAWAALQTELEALLRELAR